jgi:hypothetical protein
MNARLYADEHISSDQLCHKHIYYVSRSLVRLLSGNSVRGSYILTECKKECQFVPRAPSVFSVNGSPYSGQNCERLALKFIKVTRNMTG